MSEPLFEQYKAALRRGHVAALSGRLDEALDAYREAARLVPERALPLASQGTILHRLGRWPEAAERFDRALRVAPDDEASLRARAVAREERGLLSESAADFERLAFVLDVAGRPDKAADAARRAAELEPSTARAALAERLADAAARAGDVGAVGRPVHEGIAGEAPAALHPGSHEQLLAADAEVDAIASDEVPPAADEDLPPPERIVPVTAAEAARAAQTEDPAGTWPLIDQPSPHPLPVVGPPPDPEALMAEAAQALDAGDSPTARDKMLLAATVHRDAGRLDAALDACLQLLAMAPGDPQVHLAIANLQLDHGWTTLAREKLELLQRLTALTGDTQAEADVHGLAAERLRDEPAAAAAGG